MSNNHHTPELQNNDLVSPYRTEKHSEPVEGHGGTKYENVDAGVGLVLWSLSVIAGT